MGKTEITFIKAKNHLHSKKKKDTIQRIAKENDQEN